MSEQSFVKKEYTEDQNQAWTIESMQPLFESYISPQDLLPHMPSLDAFSKETITHLAEHGLRKDAVSEMIREVLKSDLVRREFIAALRKEGCKRFLDIIDDKAPSSGQVINEAYEVILKYLEGDLQYKIVPSQIIVYMRDYLTDSEYQMVLAREEREGPIVSFRMFFVFIQRKQSDWPLAFLKALYKHNERSGPMIIEKLGDEVLRERLGLNECENEDVPESLPQDSELPSSDDQRNMQPSDNDQTDVKEVVRSDERCAQRIVGNMEIVEEGNISSDVDFSDDEKFDTEDKEKSEYEELGVEELQMRRYQLELAEKAIEGQNTIICAPTGSGKTRVAVYIIKHHLENRPADKRKVIFLAKTVPLVTQQHRAFERHLSDKYKIMAMTGESEESAHLHNLMGYYDIIVITPQILENHLKLGKIKSLSEFSLMVFDECHHTRKGEPYNRLMYRYIKAKLREKRQLPQIIGLTASLGVEKASTEQEAKKSILGLCANMDADYISTVEINKDELTKMVPVPEEKAVPLLEKRNDPGRKAMEDIMRKIEEMLIDVSDLHDPAIDKLLMSRPNDRNCQAYGQWAVQLKKAARLAETEGRYSDEDPNPEKAKQARIMIGLAEHLIIYNEALDIHDIVHIRDVLAYLSKKFHSCKDYIHLPQENKILQMFSDLRKKLMKLQQHEGNKNPNLSLLADTLTSLLVGKDDDARGIIFVRTRATCKALAEWFSSDEVSDVLKDLKATAFTGARAHEEEGGMTQNDQEIVIAKFKEGEIKLLIATSVAEEGLDIPECNIILRYNHVGNEISTIQTRGRSRKAGGTTVILGNNKILNKEKLNMARIIMMEKAVLAVKRMDSRIYREKILSLQQEALMKEDIEQEVKRSLITRKTDGEFTLICGRCREHCITSSDLRTIHQTHYIVIGDDFSGKCQIIRDKKQKKAFDEIQITGKIRCNNCHNLWGVMFLYKHMSLPSLGIKYFTLIHADGSQSIYKKWKDVPYSIAESGLEDFKRVLKQRTGGGMSLQVEDGSGPQAEGGSEPNAEGGSEPKAEGGSEPKAEGGSLLKEEDGSGQQEKYE